MTENKSKELAVCLLAFLIPAAVMLWAYHDLGVAPWGDNTVLISDMSTQYVEFFCALKNGDLFFSWSKALGTSYIGVFSYYVSSPLSILTLLVPNEDMPVGLMFLTVLKIGLAGASFAGFSLKRFPGSGLSSLLCAVCYALMAYNAVYALCIMWLDGVIWLPLILLGLERILDGRGFGPFVAALTVCFFSTWYISYMVGGFCLLYFIARVVMLKPERAVLWKQIGRFLGGAACALGLTAWMWLPTFLAMFAGKFSGGNVGYDGLFTADPQAILERLWSWEYTSITYTALPYLFCGTVVLLLGVVYFFQRRLLREKLASLGLGIALGASLVLSPLDKVWHLFQKPNWFPYRYAFLVSFFLIFLANQALPPLIAAGRKYASSILVKGAVLAVLAVTVFQLGASTQDILHGLNTDRIAHQSNQAYREDYAANAGLVNAANLLTPFAPGDDRVFYRMGATEDRGFNSPLTFGYPGITHYSSLYNYDVNQLLKKLGFAQAWMWCAYYGSTPVTDALLDIRYVISRGELPYEAVARSGGYTLYDNPDVLPLAFLSDGDTAPVLSDAITPFERQNDLLSDLAGTPVSAFVPLNTQPVSGIKETSFTLAGSGLPVYADLSANALSRVYVNGQLVLALGTSEAASIHYLGTPEVGEAWTITIFHNGNWHVPDPFLWELDEIALSTAVEAVEKADILSVESNGAVRLSVTADSSHQLLTTIPAEDGWIACVDGKRVEHGCWLDAFLSVPVAAGAHTVELRYTAPGLMPGIALGGMAVLGLIAAALWKRKTRK